MYTYILQTESTYTHSVAAFVYKTLPVELNATFRTIYSFPFTRWLNLIRDFPIRVLYTTPYLPFSQQFTVDFNSSQQLELMPTSLNPNHGLLYGVSTGWCRKIFQYSMTQAHDSVGPLFGNTVNSNMSSNSRTQFRDRDNVIASPLTTICIWGITFDPKRAENLTSRLRLSNVLRGLKLCKK